MFNILFGRVVLYILIDLYLGRVQQCHGSKYLSASQYGLCDLGDVITSLNGSIITGSHGVNCARIILAPKGYRIDITVHKNTRFRDQSDLFLYDGGTRHGNSKVAKLTRFHGLGSDRIVTSTSNAVLIYMDELKNTHLNISFVMFRQPSQRCACLPVIDGKTVCTLTSHFTHGDTLDRECKMDCQQGYDIPNRLYSPGSFQLRCEMNHNKHEYKWEAPVVNDIKLEDDKLITCSKVSPATRLKAGFSFNYNNVSCRDIDVKLLEHKVREHIVNHTSVPSFGECFKHIPTTDNLTCMVESLNVSCSSINNDTTSQIILLVRDNYLMSANETIAAQRYRNLYNAYAANLTNSLIQFIRQNLTIHDTSVTDLTQLHPTHLASCSANEVTKYLIHLAIFGCQNCPEHFHKSHWIGGIYRCKKCANGTRRKNDEQTCVPGLRDYPKPSVNYCQHTCDLGKYFNINSTLCDWCPYGTYQNSTTALNPACNTCPDGMTTGFVGAKNISECIHLCQAGQYLKHITCVMCGVGHFMPNASNRFHKCYPCPTGYTTLDIGTKDGCVEKCSLGKYFNMTARVCTLCPNNTFQDEVHDNNTRSCKKCPSKTVTANAGSRTASACLGPCGAGQYVDAKLRNCTPCPQNTYHDVTEHTSFSCKPCGSHKVTQNHGSTNSSECIYTCSKGEFFNVTSETCEKCSNGTYQNDIGKDFCIPCPGKTFTLKIGSEQCIDPCQFGQFLNKSAELCQDCSIGYYQNISDYTSDICFPCQIDFYNDKPGRKNCSACPDNTITVITGADTSSECIETCEPGTYLNKSRKSCQKCFKGFYQDQEKYRLEHCTKCPSVNLTTMTTGASNLEQCVGYCTSSPCLNGGDCVNIDNGFSCTCSKYISGEICNVIIDEKDADSMELSLRFPTLIWTQNLSSPESKEFIELATEVENSIRQEFQSDVTFRTVEVKEFRPGSVISDVQFKYVAGVSFSNPVDTLSSAIADGKLGNLSTDNTSLKIVNFTCTQPLGMENGRIPDDAITAGISVHYHPPKNARLNFPGAGWAPQYLSGDEVYLQVDLREEVLLTAIATQGSSYHEGSWLQAFYFQYSSDSKKWSYYNTSGIYYDVFPANDDVNTTVRNELKVPIKTQYIRIFEYHFKEWISYRVEFYGCPIPKILPLPATPSPLPTGLPKTTTKTTSVVDAGDEDDSTNVGLIVGLVLGILALCVLVAVGFWWVRKKKDSHSFGHGSTVNAMQLKETKS